MGRIVEFATNHFILVSSFMVLWILFFVTESRRAGQVLSPQQATNMVNRQNAIILDIRNEDDFRKGHIPGSINIPYARLTERANELERHREAPLIIVCNMGNHASAAGRLLKNQEFAQVARIRGGIQAWRAENLPVSRA